MFKYIYNFNDDQLAFNTSVKIIEIFPQTKAENVEIYNETFLLKLTKMSEFIHACLATLYIIRNVIRAK